jgi:hypothetical protein
MKGLHRTPFTETVIRFVDITARQKYFELGDEPVLKNLLAKLMGAKSKPLTDYHSDFLARRQRDSPIPRRMAEYA